MKAAGFVPFFGSDWNLFLPHIFCVSDLGEVRIPVSLVGSSFKIFKSFDGDKNISNYSISCMGPFNRNTYR